MKIRDSYWNVSLISAIVWLRVVSEKNYTGNAKINELKLNNSALILIDRDGGNQFFYSHNPSVHFWSDGFLFWFSLIREELGNEIDH